MSTTEGTNLGRSICCINGRSPGEYPRVGVTREAERRSWGARAALMAYVERGVVKSKRSFWRLSTITHFFWAIVNFIGVFFITMFSKERSDEYKKASGSGKKWDGGPGGGPGGGSGRGPYGGPRGPRGMADLRSNDHNALPACGSCCGG